ncbi:hypothetical protein DL93DRAFT_2079956 [Clavulina sp. PMI_390]|nr:hypothetical protein DL93DRAFT_2079956 [Clavulina sp. PMI_390]
MTPDPSASTSSQPSTSINNASAINQDGPKKRSRKSLNCDPCRLHKLKCNRARPCSGCVYRGTQHLCFTNENEPASSAVAPPSASASTASAGAGAGPPTTVSAGSANPPPPSTAPAPLDPLAEITQIQASLSTLQKYYRSIKKPPVEDTEPERNLKATHQDSLLGSDSTESYFVGPTHSCVQLYNYFESWDRDQASAGVPSSSSKPSAPRQSITGPGSTNTSSTTSGAPNLSRLLLSTDLLQYLPSKPTLEVLVKEYVTYATWMHRYIDEYEIRAKLERYVISGELDELTLAMFFALCGVTLYYLPADHQVRREWTDDTSTVAKRYYTLAQTIIDRSYDNLMTHPSIPLIEIHLLMGHYQATVKTGESGEIMWSLAHKMIILAMSMGLHREFGTDRGLPEREVVRRRWVWWNVLSFERWMCVLLGRPMSIANDQFNTAYPIALPPPASSAQGSLTPNVTGSSPALGGHPSAVSGTTSNGGAHNSSSGNANNTTASSSFPAASSTAHSSQHTALHNPSLIHLAMFQYYRLLGDILDDLNDVVRPLSPQRVEVHDAALRAWRSSWPDDIELTEYKIATSLARTSEERVQRRGMQALHLMGTYHYTRFILHRTVRSASTPEVLATAATALVGLLSRCVHDIMYNPRMRVLGQLGIGPYYVLLPGIFFTHQLLENPDSPASTNFRASLADVISIAQMSEAVTISAHTKRLLGPSSFLAPPPPRNVDPSRAGSVATTAHGGGSSRSASAAPSRARNGNGTVDGLDTVDEDGMMTIPSSAGVSNRERLDALRRLTFPYVGLDPILDGCDAEDALLPPNTSFTAGAGGEFGMGGAHGLEGMNGYPHGAATHGGSIDPSSGSASSMMPTPSPVPPQPFSFQLQMGGAGTPGAGGGSTGSAAYGLGAAAVTNAGTYGGFGGFGGPNGGGSGGNAGVNGNLGTALSPALGGVPAPAAPSGAFTFSFAPGQPSRGI